MDHISAAASFEAYNRQEIDPLLSAEALAESNSMIDFKTFADEYPERLFPLISRLRPEFQEFFIEFHILRKSQAFIGKCHGQIQTRVWQVLRLVEQAIGSMIILGTSPDAEIIRPILRKAGLDSTIAYGSLTDMILLYAKTQSYAEVALRVGAPVPLIRKLFRPTIVALLANKDVRAVAVGAYLRSLTHQASLTGTGLSKRCKARNRRVKIMRFTAPRTNNSTLISFNRVESLGDTPWHLLEISSEHRMAQIGPTLYQQGIKLFGKKPAQIFAPLNADGELVFGYVFARSSSFALVRKLLHIRGVAELSAVCDSDGNFDHAVTVPNAEVQELIAKHSPSTSSKVRVGNFVKVLTGPASNYCGTVTKVDGDGLIVQVNFPTGRCFLVRADETSVKLLPATPAAQRMFWGVLGF